MSNSSLNTKDKNNIIISLVFVGMIALAVAFFVLSRLTPFIFMMVGIIVLELLYVLPQVCDKYYKLFGMEAGFGKYIPYFNALLIFPKVYAIVNVVMPIITVIAWYLAVGPMFWTTLKNLSTFSEVQSTALGVAFILTVIWNFTFGAAFAAVMKDVNERRAEFFNISVPRAELIYYVLTLFPFARCFALFNELNSLNFLIKQGYESGKDYSAIEFEED